MLIIAHRGVGEPRNTLNSFRRAIELGFGVEFDVWMTGDGRLVILHDPEFTSGGRAHRVKDLTLSDLRALHPLGESIPTVEDILKVSDGPMAILNADVKDPEAVPRLLELTSEFDALDRVIFSSTDPGVLSDIRRLSERARLAFSIVRERDIATFPWLKPRLGLFSLHVPLDGVERVSMPVFKLLFRWARLIGLKIVFWSYEADEMRLLPRLMGYFDYVIADDPVRVRDLMSLAGVEVEPAPQP